MQYVIPPIKKIVDPNKLPPKKFTEDNFYEVQTTKCTKILYQTDTIRPAVSTTHCRPDSLVTWPLHFTTLDWTYFSPKLDLPQLYTGLTLDVH